MAGGREEEEGLAFWSGSGQVCCSTAVGAGQSACLHPRVKGLECMLVSVYAFLPVCVSGQV